MKCNASYANLSFEIRKNLSKGDVFQEMPIIEIIRYTSDVLKDLSQMRKIQVPDYCSCLGNFLNVGIGES